MTVLRCTAKLLKRLRQSPKLPEPSPQLNPLGEWHADVDFWNRKPFVLVLNASTGATLVLNGNAAGLKALHERAALQFASLCAYFGIEGPRVDAEAAAFASGFSFGQARDRSLLASINGRRTEAWLGFEWRDESLAEAAAGLWEHGLFKHPSLGRNEQLRSDHHRTLDLLRQRLCAPADLPKFRAAQR
ncbi:MAG: DUF6933 domain-containing protein [Pseudomonadota bacterium]